MTTLSDTAVGLRKFGLVLALLLTSLNSGPVRAEEAGTLNNQQIEQLVAPIALYPDSLISQVLMAATYPLEVVEAARWAKENSTVKGQALEDAMQKQPWDPSVKALTAVPQTLAMMNDQLKWTQDLGDAFLAQQSDVLDAVQRLRARADAAGNLKSTPQQKVVRTNRPAGSPAGAPAQAYVIESANPDEYFVPIYDPALVYGAWPYATYMPFYWYPQGYVATGLFGFAAGAFVGAAIWGNVNWWNRRVGVNVNRYNQFNRTRITNNTWTHNAAHRHGVAYGNAKVAAQFGDKGRDKARDAARQKFAEKGKGGMGGGMGDGGMGGMGEGGMGSKAQPKGGMGEGGLGKGSKAQPKGGMGEGGMGKGSKGQPKGGMGEGGMGKGSKAQPKGGMGAGGMTGGGGMGGGMGGMPGGGGMGGMPGGGGMGGMPGGGMGFQGGGMMGGGMAAAFRGGGGMMGGGGRGGGRRSDAALKHDVALLGYLDNGLGFYRFAYKGSDTAYVGVMAQEVQRVRPDAVVRGRDGYLRVFYDKLGVTFQTYDQWLASGAQVPSIAR